MLEAPSYDVQNRALGVINDFYNDARRLSQTRRNALLKVYETVATFEQPKSADWQTSFKVNKAFVAETKMVARLSANRPRWIVSKKSFREDVTAADVEAIQDVLDFLFEKQALWTKVKMWLKSMLRYGYSFARPRFEFLLGYRPGPKDAGMTSDMMEAERIRREAARLNMASGESVQPANAEQVQPFKVENVTKKEFEKMVVDEYPTIDIIPWTDMFFDPRHVFVENMPATVHNIERVRWAAIWANKDKYFNVDLIQAGRQGSSVNSTPEKTSVWNIKGIGPTEIALDANAINLKRFVGYFSETGDPDDEMLYRMTAIGNGDRASILIELKQVKSREVVDMKCFEDTDSYFPTGIVEPMIGLQDELNFQKNSAAQYMNLSLNRSFFWDPNSGVNPADLQSKPGNVIPCSNVKELELYLKELPMRELPGDYWRYQNDIERQLQTVSLQIDVASTPPGNGSATNTATGARIGFFDTNVVVNDIRQNFEASMVQLAYQFLDLLFDNVDDFWVIKKIGAEQYFRLHKTLFQDAFGKYNIQIEANSTSYDDIESRRDDAIAFYNFLAKAGAGNPRVQTDAAIADVIDTFEKRDSQKYLAPLSPTDIINGGGRAPSTFQPAKRPMDAAAALTTDVARGADQFSQQ